MSDAFYKVGLYCVGDGEQQEWFFRTKAGAMTKAQRIIALIVKVRTEIEPNFDFDGSYDEYDILMHETGKSEKINSFMMAVSSENRMITEAKDIVYKVEFEEETEIRSQFYE